jgi:hypothetical protein
MQQIYANDILGQVARQVGNQKMQELYQAGKLMVYLYRITRLCSNYTIN